MDVGTVIPAAFTSTDPGRVRGICSAETENIKETARD